jgi:hypothetical protein
LTRSRAYKKNDQAWIEQKNGSVVRRLVGYGRLEGAAAAEVLGKLHKAARLYVNYFQPSFKLKSKERESAKVRKTVCNLARASRPVRSWVHSGGQNVRWNSAAFEERNFLFSGDKKIRTWAGLDEIEHHQARLDGLRLTFFPVGAIWVA